jgi:hypothetical protein
MNTRTLIILAVVVITSACVGRGGGSSSNIVEFVESGSYAQGIPVNTSTVLPPYGVQAVAETTALRLRVESAKNDPAQKLQDMQQAIEQIRALAAESESITFAHVSVSQVQGSYARESSSSSSVQELEATAVTIKLTTPLADYEHDFMASVLAFDTFIEAIEPPDTISIEAVSVVAELGDTEPYRQQIIARVYEELSATQEAYGSTVTYEITGLYDGLQTIQLSDTEYYVYLTPTVIVQKS